MIGRLPTGEIMRLITRQIEVEVDVNGIQIKGKNLSAAEISAIRDKNYKTIGRGDVEKTVLDADSYGKDLFVEVVTWWPDSVVDMEGKPLKCNAKNKALVYEWNQGFAQVAMQKITDAVVELRKGEEKN